MNVDDLEIVADVVLGMRPILLDRPRLKSVLAEAWNRIPAGNIAQFGVGYGGTALLMAMLLKLQKSPHKLYLFESWQGLPEPALQDGFFPTAGAMKGTKRTLESAMAKASLLEHVVFHDGWIENTVAAVPRLSFAHVDFDLYGGTTTVLNALCEKCDGAIIVDDYASLNWPGVTLAVNEFLKRNTSWRKTSLIRGDPDNAVLLERAERGTTMSSSP